MNRYLKAVHVLAATWFVANSLGCRKPSGDGSAATAASAQPISVETSPVTEVEVPQTLRLTGSLHGNREVDLAANAMGRVLSVSTERGAEVKVNEAVARLDVRAAAITAQEANFQAANVRAQEAQARAECERYDKLKAKGAVSDLEYDRVATQCKTLPLSVAAAQARATLAAQNVGDGVLRAPFAGVVTERFIEVGQYVRQDSRIITLVSLDPIRLELAIPEAHIAQVKEGTRVTFTVAAYPDKTFRGNVRFLSAAVRPTTRDLIVEALVDNSDKTLRPGMFADVELTVGTHKLPGIPKTAVLERDGKSRAFFVFDGRLEERVLSLGPVAGTAISVQKGASLGEKVVVADLLQMTNGRAVR